MTTDNSPQVLAAIKLLVSEIPQSVAYPPDVHFQRHRVEPPGFEYITADDYLAVSVYTTAETSGLTLSLRLLLPDGRQQYMSESLDGAPLSSLTTTIFRLAEGYLLSATISNLGGGLNPGVCWCVLALQRADQTGTAPHTLLQQGFVSDRVTLGWPLSLPSGPSQEDDDMMKQSIVQMTSAQILALGTTPVKLVDAPGANRVLRVASLTLSFHPASTAYTVAGAQNIVLRYGAAGTAHTQTGWDGLVDQAAATVELIAAPMSLIKPAAADVANQALFVDAAAPGVLTLGDGTLTVVTTYSIDSLS